jgi:hypothetical protein
MVQLGLDAVLAGTPSSICKTKVIQTHIVACAASSAASLGRRLALGRKDSAHTHRPIRASPSRRFFRQVVCTLGPCSRSVEVIEELLRAGMNVARFNFSHGSHEYHQVSAAFCVRLCDRVGRTRRKKALLALTRQRWD